jgi:protein phosphatase
MSAGKQCQGEGVDERDEIAKAAAAASDPATEPQAEGVADEGGGASDVAAAAATSDASSEEAGAAGDHQEADAGTASAEAREAATPLAPGAVVAAYTVVRVLRSSPDETLYLAALPDDPYASSGLGAGRAFVTLFERPEGSFAAARPLVALDMRHPRVLAPRAIVARGGRELLAVDALLTAEDELAPTVAEGACLDPHSALTAGGGLADALSYLHRLHVYHLGLAPDVLHIRDGRAFLAGIEHATYVPKAEEEPEQAAELAARDANDLARSLAALAGLDVEAAPDEEAMVAGLRAIAAQGSAGAFATVNDLAAACSAALQTVGQLLSLLHVESPPQRIRVAAGATTSIGRVRSENQDACACLTMDVRDDFEQAAPVGVLLVADGMGGEAHGELASRIAARLVSAEVVRQLVVPTLAVPAFMVTGQDGAEALELPSGGSVAQALARAAAIANGQVRELARQLGQTSGTTLTAVALKGAHAALAHVGDSRAYLLRNGLLHRLTEDHSVLSRLQAIDHPLLSDPDIYVPRSMLYRSLGQEDELAVDMLEFTLAAGDRLLLCSDGLWDEVDQEALQQIFAEAADPTQCAQELVALANRSGGHDNSTAVVAFVFAVPEDDHGAPEAEAEEDAEDAQADRQDGAMSAESAVE